MIKLIVPNVKPDVYERMLAVLFDHKGFLSGTYSNARKQAIIIFDDSSEIPKHHICGKDLWFIFLEQSNTSELTTHRFPCPIHKKYESVSIQRNKIPLLKDVLGTLEQPCVDLMQPKFLENLTKRDQ